jgi:hypothetical protein
VIRPEHEMALKDCLGADDVGHSGRKLYTHLRNTHDLLESWGAPEYVCLAGLFHSVYGTRTFKHQCLEATAENRALICKLIGDEAEFLVYVFCTSDRKTFLTMGWDESGQDLKDLLEIECANLLEQAGDKRGNEKTLRRLASHPGISPAARWALVKKIKGLKDKEEAAT